MKKKLQTIRPSNASKALAAIDSFGLAVKATRRKIKPTLPLRPIPKNGR